MSDLERELEQELHRVLDPLAAMQVPDRRQAANRKPTRAFLGGAGAALTFKLLTGVAVAAAAVTVAGASTTGSLNPADWGQQVKQQVANCKAELADGQHGIGDCVSSFASGHGTAVASSARQHGRGNDGTQESGNSNGSANGNANGHAKDKPKDHTAPPTSAPTSPPTFEPEPIDPSTPHQPVSITPPP